MECNKRKSTRCVWSALVMMTFVLCVSLVTFSLRTDYSSTSQRSHNQILQSEKLTREDCTPVCGSKDCVLQSKILLEHLQLAFSTCVDFYMFACGKYLESHFVEESFITRYTKLVRIKIRRVLENLQPIPGSGSEKTKIVYDSCMKRSSEIQAVPSLLQILDNFGLRNWPNITSDFIFENFTLTKVIANLLVHDEYGFMKMDFEGDYFNIRTVFSFSAGRSSIEMKDIHLIKFEINQILKYFKFEDEAIIKIQEETEAIRSAIESLRDESVRVHEESVNSPSRTAYCFGLAAYEWADFCVMIRYLIDVAKVNEEVSKKYFRINESDFYFMKNIFPLLRNFTDRSIANYLAINVILNHLNDINLYFRLTHQKGLSDYEKLDEPVSTMDRWQYCVDWISNEMTLGLAYVYLNTEFTFTMLDEMSNLTDEVIHETAEYFSRQEWMSEKLRNYLTKEIRNIVRGISYLNLLTADSVNELYEQFQPREGSFLRNIMELRKFKRIDQMRGFHVHDFGKIFFPQAYGGGGDITINLGLLLPPTYSTRVKRIFNIVSLGMIVVHEIGHNIFYKDNIEQFNHEEKNYFETKRKCIADQVSQYRFQFLGKNLNGSQYFREDIADNLAVPVIDKFIERYLAQEDEISLPGLHYSTKQLLYISSTLTWCSVTSKEKEELQYTIGSHTPALFRIHQWMKNSKGFSEAFECPVGSSMNPANKCLILTESEAI